MKRAACFASGSGSGSGSEEEELGRSGGKGKVIGGRGIDLSSDSKELDTKVLNPKDSDTLSRNTLSSESNADHSHYLYDELYEESAPQKISSSKGESKYAAKFIQRAKERKERGKPITKDPNSTVIITEGYKSHTNHQSISELHTQELDDQSFIKDQIAHLKAQKNQQFTEKYIEIISTLMQSSLGKEEIEEARKRYFERAKKARVHSKWFHIQESL